MYKLIRWGVAGVLWMASTGTTHEEFAKYKKVEAYEIRPGILMMPRYSADGQVCEIGLQKLQYSPEMIRLDSALSRKEIDQVFDELVPAEQRGSQSTGFVGSSMTEIGQGLTITKDFEKVSIQIYGALSSSSKREATVNEVAATLKWKNRNCQ
jgi:hypothetical protein